MDTEKKPIEKVADEMKELVKAADEIKELVHEVGSIRSDISYIKVQLIQHIKSIDIKNEVKEREITKGWLFF